MYSELCLHVINFYSIKLCSRVVKIYSVVKTTLFKITVYFMLVERSKKTDLRGRQV